MTDTTTLSYGDDHDEVLSQESYALQRGLLNKKLSVQKEDVRRAAAKMFTGKGSKEDFDQMRSELQAIEYQIEGLDMAYEGGLEIERRQKASIVRARWAEEEPKLKDILERRLQRADDMEKAMADVTKAYKSMVALSVEASDLIERHHKFRKSNGVRSSQDTERSINESRFYAFREIAGLSRETQTCADILTQAGLPVHKAEEYRANRGMDAFGNRPSFRLGAEDFNDEVERTARLVSEFDEGDVR